MQLQNIYSRGNPDLASLRHQLSEHGTGRLFHQSLSGDFFVFRFVWNGHSLSYDILIEHQRDYGGRNSEAGATHRLGLLFGRPRICIRPGKEPRDLPTAILFAMLWAERTSRYIRDGQPWS